jgi:hypothetical protein
MTILLFLLGGIVNRIRGGWLYDILHKYNINYLCPYVKQFNDFVFAITFSYLLGNHLNNKGLIEFAILYVSMWSGRSLGWGIYINGMIEKRVIKEEEIKIIDKIFLSKSNYPVLRNCLALSARGLIWTNCFLMGFVSLDCIFYFKTGLLLQILGLLMGPIYLLSMEICQRIPGFIRGNGWQLGEFFWGSVLWTATYLIIKPYI